MPRAIPECLDLVSATIRQEGSMATIGRILGTMMGQEMVLQQGADEGVVPLISREMASFGAMLRRMKPTNEIWDMGLYNLLVSQAWVLSRMHNPLGGGFSRADLVGWMCDAARDFLNRTKRRTY